MSGGTICHVSAQFITKTCLYNFDPLKLHFYIVKLGFTGVYISFLISVKKHKLWVRVRTASPRRFKQVSTIYVLSRNMKNIRIFYRKSFLFLVIIFSVYLNRSVFVMCNRKVWNSWRIKVTSLLRRRRNDIIMTWCVSSVLLERVIWCYRLNRKSCKLICWTFHNDKSLIQWKIIIIHKCH